MTNHGGPMPEGWDQAGERRADGLRLVLDQSGGWNIVMPGAPELRRCPCCGALLMTKKAARLVADWAFPLDAPV